MHFYRHKRITFFFWHKLKNSIAKGNTKYNQPGQANATQVEILKVILGIKVNTFAD